ncbi:hypothetical protein C8E89_11477 [Mycolicibacterium moriokaense]|uniref:Uncharacterized protein n=1 Tax=Mycolicibacterium moriokaense TaxID=39691 RepID=A0A318HD94_9MYCO|nr:hypothetical protein C8E89_11477 [Mycolicibacterium moriokaense]
MNPLQLKDNAECCIDAAHLVRAEVANALAETIRVDRRGLFSEHSSHATVDLYLGPKACLPR